MKGRCYHKNPCDYFIQYTGDNYDEVIEFLHEIDADIDLDGYDIKELEVDGEKILHFECDTTFYHEEFSVSIGSFLVIDDGCDAEIYGYSEREFHKYLQIAEDIAEDEGGAK